MLENLYHDFLLILPKILLGIGFLICAILVYKIVLWSCKKILKVSRIDKLNEMIQKNELFSGSNFKLDLGDVILGVVKFILVLIIMIVGADFLNLTIVSVQIGKLLEYLPQLFTGVLIFMVGVYFASKAKKLIYNLIKSLDAGGAKAISGVVFYLIVIFVSITALNQIGIETEIISKNISYFIGAALVSITIAVGLGSRDIVYRLILGYYTKKNLEIGMRIQLNEIVGTIEAIDNICLVLQTGQQRMVIPIKKINNSEVIILPQA